MSDAPGSLARTADAPADDVWPILRMILWSAEYLRTKGVETGRLDAEHLLAHVLGMPRLQLYLQYERPLAPEELDAYRPLLKRRATREPLQHILGVQAFRELELEVDGSVLVPRSETELLVDAVLEWARDAGRSDLAALDIGTGSGAIALSLAMEGPFARVVATDVADDALEVARRNRATAGLDGRVELREGDLFQPVGVGERFDVVVSNPPYVPDGDAAGLQPEVRDWEPGRALFAGHDGLDVLRRLVSGAPTYMERGALFAVEVGLGQAAAVVRMIMATGQYDAPGVLRDYSGRERFVLAHGRR